MLQIVREPTKRFDVLLRLQVLLMLAFQLRVDRRDFRARLDAAGLLLLRVQNRESAEIHQCADVEDFLTHRTGEWCIGRNEAQVAHGEGDDGDGHRRGRRGGGR